MTRRIMKRMGRSLRVGMAGGRRGRRRMRMGGGVS